MPVQLDQVRRAAAASGSGGGRVCAAATDAGAVAEVGEPLPDLRLVEHLDLLVEGDHLPGHLAPGEAARVGDAGRRVLGAEEQRCAPATARDGAAVHE